MPDSLANVLIVAHLTWIEARRRRIVLAALIGGAAFLILYWFAAAAINRAGGVESTNLIVRFTEIQFLLMAGLFVANFMVIAFAVLLPVDTLSGEIDSGVMQTLASKPVRRAEILLGKWLTFFLMSGAYLILMAGGIMAIVIAITGVPPTSIVAPISLMLLGATVLLTISFAGGARFTTITNGIIAFAFFGLAFIGGWIEQIGAMARNETAQRIGTAISLLSPSDAMWRRAAYEFMPPVIRDLQQLTPFTSVSVPSAAMVGWAVAFVAAVLGLAIFQFQRRPL